MKVKTRPGTPALVVRAVMALSAAALVVAGGLPGTAPRADAQSVLEGPPASPFYTTDPKTLADAKPGQIIKTRPAAMLAFNEWPITEIAYRSNDTHGHPILATATVVRPHNPVPDAPVLSYQHYLNALGGNCAPTETLSNITLETAQDNVMAILRLQLRKGWTVLIPNHLGPNTAYPGGQLSGRIVLDGMRAVRDSPLFDSRHSKFTGAGYSGGGIATAFAAAMHHSYAPDVDLVGVAQGGVPSDLQTMARFLGNDPHPAFGLAFAAAVGMAREYPEIKLENKLTPQGWAMYDKLKDACTARLIIGGAFRSVPQVLKGGDIFAEHELMDAFAKNSLVNFPEIPDVPVFMWHSRNDPLVPFWDAETVAKRYCREGVPLTFVAGNFPEHLSGALEKLPSAFRFVDDRAAGIPAPRQCYV